MNFTLILFFGLVALLLGSLLWALRGPRKSTKRDVGPGSFEEADQRHVNFLPQIRQALAKADYDFLAERVSAEVLRRVRRERRDVARAYLAALRKDFQSLLRMANVIAALSPELVVLHEFERLRLTTKFAWQFEMIRWKLLAGFAPLPQLDGLSNLVSGLSVRMEAAVKELGERAAAGLASSMKRPGVDVA